MAFQDITDPGAVQLAIAEFDRVGTDSFLTRYGFKKARAFFLAVGGREYDSKAIAGAAHGYQFPNLGPLHPSDFSGGEATVARKLRSLGFTVIRKDIGPDADADTRNPIWNRDELILALDAYVMWNGRPPAKTSAAIAELSRLLNELHRLLGTPRGETLRNPSGVYMKLMNFRIPGRSSAASTCRLGNPGNDRTSHRFGSFSERH
jgi:5-methylcytosine-specific restriction protein A